MLSTFRVIKMAWKFQPGVRLTVSIMAREDVRAINESIHEADLARKARHEAERASLNAKVEQSLAARAAADDVKRQAEQALARGINESIHEADLARKARHEAERASLNAKVEQSFAARAAADDVKRQAEQALARGESRQPAGHGTGGRWPRRQRVRSEQLPSFLCSDLSVGPRTLRSFRAERATAWPGTRSCTT